MLYDIGHDGLAYLDENIFNTWQSQHGTPMALVGRSMEYVQVDKAVGSGPGAFINHAILERGYNAWYEAPGYYVDAPGTDRVIHDQYVRLGVYQPHIYGSNPWDWVFGTIGSYGHDDGVGVRDWPNQTGEYSLS